jgi:hypothetical protein
LLALGGRNPGNGIAFLVAAGIVFEIIAYCCSSPQTMEINAVKRAPTLMKYVHIGQVQAGAFIGVAAFMDKKHQNPILLGGGLAMAISEVLYLYSKQAGLANPGPETETY